MQYLEPLLIPPNRCQTRSHAAAKRRVSDFFHFYDKPVYVHWILRQQDRQHYGLVFDSLSPASPLT